MTKAAELREMSDEQLGVTLTETTESFFRLRLQAQTERLDAPSELRKQRRLIARIRTIQHERAAKAGHDEALRLVSDHKRKLCGKGLGWIDVHLLASSLLTGCTLWTRDKPLAAAARALKVGA